MDFTLTDEQNSFRKMLRDFVQREIEPVARDWELSGRYPAEIIEQMKAMGLFGLLVPAEYGGAAADFISFALTFEEIARGWMGVAGTLGSHSIACWLIARYGTGEQKQRFLPDLASGARRSGIALTEPHAGSDLQGIKTTARREGDHYVVNGTKMWITNARYADPLPTLVKTDPITSPPHKGMSVLLIEATLPGFSVSRDIPKLGYKGTESCEVVLDEVRVPAECLLGSTEGRGLQQVLSALETGRINVAARALGVAQASYDKAIAYSRQRNAFGHPISDFQAIQLKLADIATEVQAARLLTYWAASKLDRGERADLESSMAKLFASEVALKASLESMRIHGGYGYSSEFEVERYYRDAPLMAIGEGTSDILRTVIAKQLLSGTELV
jgi:alkylation response protein AidB-like acyl-CoA dehydrogenase